SWALARESQRDEFSLARWDGLAWLCAMTSSTTGAMPQISQPTNTPDISDFSRIQNEADALARRAAESNWSESSARALLNALATSDADFAGKKIADNLLGQRAKRLVLALDRLTNALNQNSGTHLPIDTQLNQLFQD